jgi:myosin heavy subunit
MSDVCELVCSEEEVSCLWRLLAVLLHLGNLEYQWDEDENREVQLLSPKVSHTFTHILSHTDVQIQTKKAFSEKKLRWATSSTSGTRTRIGRCNCSRPR